MLFLSESVRRGRAEKERKAEKEREAGECKEEVMTRTVHKSSCWRRRGIVHQGPSLLRCESYLCILDMSSIGYTLCKYFFPVCSLPFYFLSRVPIFLIVSFKEQKLLFVESDLGIFFSLTVHVFCDLSKNTSFNSQPQTRSPMFSSFIVLV